MDYRNRPSVDAPRQLELRKLVDGLIVTLALALVILIGLIGWAIVVGSIR